MLKDNGRLTLLFDTLAADHHDLSQPEVNSAPETKAINFINLPPIQIINNIYIINNYFHPNGAESTHHTNGNEIPYQTTLRQLFQAQDFPNLINYSQHLLSNTNLLPDDTVRICNTLYTEVDPLKINPESKTLWTEFTLKTIPDSRSLDKKTLNQADNHRLVTLMVLFDTNPKAILEVFTSYQTQFTHLIKYPKVMAILSDKVLNLLHGSTQLVRDMGEIMPQLIKLLPNESMHVSHTLQWLSRAVPIFIEWEKLEQWLSATFEKLKSIDYWTPDKVAQKAIFDLNQQIEQSNSQTDPEICEYLERIIQTASHPRMSLDNLERYTGVDDINAS